MDEGTSKHGFFFKSLLNLLQYYFCFVFCFFWPQGMWDRTISWSLMERKSLLIFFGWLTTTKYASLGDVFWSLKVVVGLWGGEARREGRQFKRYFYLFDCTTSLLHLVPWPGINPGPPVLGARSFSHWITREVPPCSLCLLPRAESHCETWGWLYQPAGWNTVQTNFCCWIPKNDGTMVLKHLRNNETCLGTEFLVSWYPHSMYSNYHRAKITHFFPYQACFPNLVERIIQPRRGDEWECWHWRRKDCET